MCTIKCAVCFENFFKVSKDVSEARENRKVQTGNINQVLRSVLYVQEQGEAAQ